MSDLATLFIKVDSKGVVTASKDLNKLTGDSKKSEKATEGVTTGFNKLKVAVIALGGAYAALKMFQYIKDATMLAARYETLGVVMRVVGNNAGFSAKQMDEFARGLQKAGIAMIESRNTLARMVQAQIDLNKSSELARIAQDAAVIGNLNSSESFERLINGIQRGMPILLKTIGINVQFEQGYMKMATALGISTNSLTKLQKVQSRTNTVIEAGILIAGAYEGAMDTAGKQVLSLKRHLDNLKVLFGTVFTPALAESIGVITGVIKDQNKELEKNIEKWADWGNNLRLRIMEVEFVMMNLALALDIVGQGFTKLGLIYGAFGKALSNIPGFEGAGAHFDFFADQTLMFQDRFNVTNKAIEELTGRYNELIFAMSPAGKELLKQIEATEELFRLEKTRLRDKGEGEEKASKEQLKIQSDFSKLYRKSVLTTQEFELSSLKIQVEAFRKAKVNEIQLEEWMQNEIKNIKLRAQNEALALFEELAQNDAFYAQKAIDVMSEILDAEEKKWAKILKDDDAAHTLRIQKEEEYRDKVLGTIDDIAEAQTQATRQIVSGTTTTPAAPSAASSLSGSTRIGQTFTIYSYNGRDFSSQAAVNAYMQRLQAGQDAADEVARIAQQATEDAAQRAQDILNQRIELEIQLLEATGFTVEAVGIRRLQELAAMDESLRPLQQRLFLLEDEAAAIDAANQQVADAQNAAAKAAQTLVSAEKAAERATDALAGAQQKQAEASRNSLAALVSQGQTIQDFINSLGATGVSMSFSAARSAYLADLAGAQAGDVTSFNRITGSAGAFISKAGQTAGSSVELARIVADIKSELSSLAPVAELESNMEDLAIENNRILELIATSTEDTSVSAAQTDLNTADTVVEAALTAVSSADAAVDAALTAQATVSANTTAWDKNNSVSDIFDAIETATELTASNTGKFATFGQLGGLNGGQWNVFGGNGQLLSFANLSRPEGISEAEWAALIVAARPQFHAGGIATGPESGYQATLHGTELVVSPNASFPATVKGGDSPRDNMLLERIATAIETGNFQIAKNTGKTAKTLTRFDFDGMPPERTQ